MATVMVNVLRGLRFVNGGTDLLTSGKRRDPKHPHRHQQQQPHHHHHQQEQQQQREFERMLQAVAAWMTQWDHSQRCSVLRELVRWGGPAQAQLLWTALQPALHRDFMYMGQRAFPGFSFAPVSTEWTRKARGRVGRGGPGGATWVYREPSVFLPERGERGGTAPPAAQRPPCAHRDVDWQRAAAAGAAAGTTRRGDEKGPSLRRTGGLVLPALHTRTGKVALNDRSPAVEPPTWGGFSRRQRRLFHCYERRWDDAMRNRFLRWLLPVLDPRQLYFLSTLLAAKNHRDFVALLPESLALRILSFLSPRDLLQAAGVSRAWRRLCDHGSLWFPGCVRLGAVTALDVTSSSSSMSSSSSTRWRAAYWRAVRTRRNWDEGAYRQRLLLSGHVGTVTCVCVRGTSVASGGRDGTVRVWEAPSGRCVAALSGHGGPVRGLGFLCDGLLVSGSRDRTLKIWNLRTGDCARTLCGHEGPIWAVAVGHELICSASHDRTVKVWSGRHCRLRHSLLGHSRAVFAVDLSSDGSIIASGSADKTVRMWSSDTGHCLHTFHAGASTSATAATVAGRASPDGGATGSDASRRAAPPALRQPRAAGAAVSAVSCAGEWLASGAGATLRLHHLPTRRLVWSSTAAASTKQVTSVLLVCGARPGPCQDGFTPPSPPPLPLELVSAWSDGEVWCHSLDLDGLSPRVHSLRGDGAGVTSVAGHVALLVAGCRDGTVRLWDFSAPQ
ncbi:F-box/WD repeat-containing protein 7-like [Lethenteron reissneri]|uniref:F-box/WD repeat-containing protein 7-like n=1 Tax=Lethenteron reissneri TaxID=7753 RepID=UPI002AB692C7|nr:F-box/WD repeat-containing protein 7-like [Lethenteron reissneri]